MHQMEHVSAYILLPSFESELESLVTETLVGPYVVGARLAHRVGKGNPYELFWLRPKPRGEVIGQWRRCTITCARHHLIMLTSLGLLVAIILWPRH